MLKARSTLIIYITLYLRSIKALLLTIALYNITLLYIEYKARIIVLYKFIEVKVT